MGPGEVLVTAATAVAAVSRPLLTSYLRARLPVPTRAQWVVSELKRRLVPEDPRQIAPIGEGLVMEVDLRTIVGREIYYHGSYEPTVARFLERIPPGAVVLDCGANVGELTLRAAAAVGPSGAVYALEASPRTAALLRRNVTLNRLHHVHVVEGALGGADGTLSLFLGAGDHSLSSSLWQPEDYRGSAVDVRVVTLTTLIRELSLRRIDLIKLDIEGAEFAALRDAPSAFAALERPPAIVFEYNKPVAGRAGWTMSAMHAALAPIGYELRYLDDGLSGRLYTPADDATFTDRTKLDFVAAVRAAR